MELWTLRQGQIQIIRIVLLKLAFGLLRPFEDFTCPWLFAHWLHHWFLVGLCALILALCQEIMSIRITSVPDNSQPFLCLVGFRLQCRSPFKTLLKLELTYGSGPAAQARCSWQGCQGIDRSLLISRISKGSQNILIYNFIITTFDCQSGSKGGDISARAFAYFAYSSSDRERETGIVRLQYNYDVKRYVWKVSRK